MSCPGGDGNKVVVYDASVANSDDRNQGIFGDYFLYGITEGAFDSWQICLQELEG